jgi:predicted dehydrogenase
MPLSVGVIGCGNIARFHFAGLERYGARVAWACDPNEAAARPWAEKLGARYAADHRQVLADPAVDAVFVTTATRFHKQICLDAIAAGKAVVCEKTLADGAADAAEIVRAAAAAGTVFYTSYMKRFIPAVEQAKAMLGEIGPVLSAHVRTHQPWGELWSSMPADGFFHTPVGGASQVRRSYGGGILTCGGSHVLDLVCFLFGRPRTVFADVFTPPGRDYDLRASALLRTDLCPVHFDALAHPHGRAGILGDGWDEQVEIVGLRGRLHVYSAMWDQPEHKGSVLVHHDGAAGTTTEHRFDLVSPFSRAVEFYCRNIEAGAQGTQSRSTGYDVDVLIEAFLQSSAQKRAVNVEYEVD